ncbi:unnamed protein product [Acanthosepion pharaonis]|uniref:Uncharacterized protein n=1 Tax=Acanthosepion pharaonis TaxID=158019 RepID=A0A812BMF9_ACAPH|nr:unnamed protein product [Sepia pharaonis]
MLQEFPNNVGGGGEEWGFDIWQKQNAESFIGIQWKDLTFKKPSINTLTYPTLFFFHLPRLLSIFPSLYLSLFFPSAHLPHNLFPIRLSFLLSPLPLSSIFIFSIPSLLHSIPILLASSSNSLSLLVPLLSSISISLTIHSLSPNPIQTTSLPSPFIIYFFFNLSLSLCLSLPVILLIFLTSFSPFHACIQSHNLSIFLP